MEKVRIQFSRFSAFYSPLIAAMSGGFLEEEGLEGEHSVSAPGISAIQALTEGLVDVVQSAPSQSFRFIERGETPPAVHFANINHKDGFFLTGRQPEDEFTWSGLAGRNVLVDHGGQPLHMFKYACLKAGLDYAAIDALDAGNTDDMTTAFRAGEGDYIHLQGPAPQQLEADGIGHVVARVGDPIGSCAFSSLASTREWLETDQAARFTRAFRKARDWVAVADPAEIAAAETSFFPEIDRDVLARTIAAYQGLGNWQSGLAITPEAFAVTVDVFRHAGVIDGEIDHRPALAPPPGQ